MISDRFGIYNATVQRHIPGHTLDLLIHDFRILVPAAVVVFIGICQRLVVSEHFVVSEVVAEVHRNGSSWLAKLLTEKDESARRPVAIISHIICEPPVGMSRITIVRTVSMEFRMLGIASGAEIELRLEDKGCILRKIVFHTYSETVSLRAGGVVACIFIQKMASVIHIRHPRALLFNNTIRAVIKVIAREFHIIVKQIP